METYALAKWIAMMDSHKSLDSPKSHGIEIHLQTSLFGGFWIRLGLFTRFYKLAPTFDTDMFLFSLLNSILAYVLRPTLWTFHLFYGISYFIMQRPIMNCDRIFPSTSRSQPINRQVAITRTTKPCPLAFCKLTSMRHCK